MELPPFTCLQLPCSTNTADNMKYSQAETIPPELSLPAQRNPIAVWIDREASNNPASLTVEEKGGSERPYSETAAAGFDAPYRLPAHGG